MTRSERELAEILAQRLCHDLAGLVGAVGGMLELVADDPEQVAEALPVARDAAVQLARRLRVVRAAWGGETAWRPDSLRRLLADLETDRLRVSLDAASLAHGQQAAVGRLLLNVAMLGAELLRGRGAVVIGAVDGTMLARLEATPPARAPGWPAELAGDADPTPTPAAFQLGWTVAMAAACGATLRPSPAGLRVVVCTLPGPLNP